MYISNTFRADHGIESFLRCFQQTCLMRPRDAGCLVCSDYTVACCLQLHCKRGCWQHHILADLADGLDQEGVLRLTEQSPGECGCRQASLKAHHPCPRCIMRCCAIVMGLWLICRMPTAVYTADGQILSLSDAQASDGWVTCHHKMCLHKRSIFASWY